MVGNNAAPGFCFMDINNASEAAPKDIDGGKFCKTVIVNTVSTDTELPSTVTFQAEPFMVLHIKPHWKNFDDYLYALTSKYRVRAKKVLDLSQSLTYSQLSGNEISDDMLLELCRLLKNTLQYKTLVMDKNIFELLQHYKKFFGKEWVVQIYKKENKIIGFLASVHLQDNIMAMHIGYESKEAKEMHLYQRMFYDLIAYGIRHRAVSLNMGRTATEIKSTFGAEPIHNQFVVYIKQKWIRTLLQYYKNKCRTEKEYVIRKPFKD